MTSWQASLTVDSLGNASLYLGGGFSYFVKQANGAYLNTDGVNGTLANSGGVFTYTDTNGTQFVFLPSGQLSYEQDTDGNRITLGYNLSPEPAKGHVDLHQPGRSRGAG